MFLVAVDKEGLGEKVAEVYHLVLALEPSERQTVYCGCMEKLLIGKFRTRTARDKDSQVRSYEAVEFALMNHLVAEASEEDFWRSYAYIDGDIFEKRRKEECADLGSAEKEARKMVVSIIREAAKKLKLTTEQYKLFVDRAVSNGWRNYI